MKNSDYYQLGKNNIYTLKNKIEVIKVLTPLVDTLLTNEVFKIRSLSEKNVVTKISLVRNLMKEIFESIYLHYGEDALLKKRLLESYKRKQIAESEIQKVEKLIASDDYKKVVDVCSIENLGDVIFIYYLDEKTTSVKIDIYYVLEFERSSLSRQVSDPRYKECLQEN
jgi:hypothetical protein